MKKKKVSFARFPDSTVIERKGRAKVYAGNLTTHQRRVQAIKKLCGDCWWLEVYLMDRCGLQNGVPKK